jgi:hypothetical protein
LGGANMLAGRFDPRGISLEIRVLTRDALGCVMFAPLSSPTGSGVTHFIAATSRRNNALMARVAEALDEHVPIIAARWLEDTPATLHLVRTLVADAQQRLRVAA